MIYEGKGKGFWILKRAPKKGDRTCQGANYKNQIYNSEADAIEAAKQAMAYGDEIDYVVLKSVYFT